MMAEHPTVVEVVETRMKEYEEALFNGDVEKLQQLDSRMKHPPVTYGDVVRRR
jgi:hypothetical protein